MVVAGQSDMTIERTALLITIASLSNRTMVSNCETKIGRCSNNIETEKTLTSADKLDVGDIF